MKIVFAVDLILIDKAKQNKYHTQIKHTHTNTMKLWLGKLLSSLPFFCFV